MKILKSEKDYDEALARVEALVDIDPDPESPEGEELEVLTLLIEKYEDELYPVSLPDPIDAILFRMEQQGLKNQDMIPYFGSKSKVSEVLNRKRPLSLTMIRKLHQELGIPADVLIAEPGRTIPEEVPGIDWARFPLKEMMDRKWISFEGSLRSARENAEELMREFFTGARFNPVQSPVFFRQGQRTDTDFDQYALSVWYARVLMVQESLPCETRFDSSTMDDAFFGDLKRLSFLAEGPLLAREFLLKFGIKLVIVPHLSATRLDGAVFFQSDGNPVVALTLRYDRLDYFWFTLFHELAHLALHLKSGADYYFDDLSSHNDLSQIEQEADHYAQEQLISSEDWRSFYSPYLHEDDIKAFAQKERISPAIVAGRIQRERDNYTFFRKLLGQGAVRKLFGDDV